MARYWVKRTSHYADSEIPPCDGATRVETLHVWDQRVVRSKEELGEDWLGRGDHHGSNATGIYRRLPAVRTHWVIDVPSIETFAAQYGIVVVVPLTELEQRESHGVQYELEIYDDYRE
jgi:hypothetical protein